MKKIVFICPYFGKLPNQQITLWLQSCRYNPTIDWIILTDDRTTILRCPDNVRLVYMTLSTLKQTVQKRFPFPISLDQPYKLCDFKPAYGYMFPQYVEGYDYWGHCDMTDCIFGNLRKFLTDVFLASADKLLFLGHMTLYRNSDEINRRIFAELKSSPNNAAKILGSSENYAFDEINSTSINTIYLQHGWEVARQDNMYVDICPLYKAFESCQYSVDFQQFIEKGVMHVFEWNEGILYDCKIKKGVGIEKTEIAYVHFQKRQMLNLVKEMKHFLIIPNKFVDADKSVTIDFIKSVSRYRIFYLPYFVLRYKNLRYYIRAFLKKYVKRYIFQ